jgi:uncharacterized protein YigE (DUF2233 family)
VRKSSPAVLLLACAAIAQAEWVETSKRSERSVVAGVEHRRVFLENPETDEQATLELAIFSIKTFTLRVIDQPAEPRVDLARAMQREDFLAAVNGGYFDPDYEPIGLLVVDGKTIAPLQRARLLTGVLTASQNGVQIVRTGEFIRKQKLQAAVECGPFLVDLGHRVRGLDDSRVARRTFAAVGNSGRAALGFCSEVTLADLSKILTAESAGDFKIYRALNLDGGSSSAFWFKRENGGAFSIPEQKTVRDFVAVVPR